MFTIKKQLLLILLILSSTNALAKAQTYIFVSFSMPDTALKSYFIEAEQASAILVMRGLKNNSFLQTKAKADELAISFNIDPNLFEQYQITSVPVIIVDNGQGRVKKLTGHIALMKAIELMEQEN
ncbi:type-F conjugative transfer system pilin assembly protein TrbC [Candidatus Tisiphia endosymbiont of Metellina segmentata]|uniref:type-F conjugative transfer system pilin assembly protein TrbC n=1 Tax=Candidatus Tisiphia endosymbiont of Metellina segmentata TaxID=3066274 RepID=UPI00313D574A